jgi:hypothetical protein
MGTLYICDVNILGGDDIVYGETCHVLGIYASNLCLIVPARTRMSFEIRCGDLDSAGEGAGYYAG